MLHHLLQHQLTELGISDSDTPPDEQAWRRLLEKISTTYDEADDRRFYQALFDQTNDAVFIIALSGKYLSVNRKAADMLGYTVAELVNMSMAQVVAPVSGARHSGHGTTGLVMRSASARRRSPAVSPTT